ncbi:hypothetical protein QFZ28_005896 [Neobacillus niacini]|uniref:sporulation histidine kinase inhibitor Sda n=1 Tax=Neobacillus niacini TaxID=86668 RepID=UPI0027885B4A|nr:hypothetical protein [Neobacillus niacini]
MYKLSTEELLDIYNKAIVSKLCKDFILLLSEEINKRLINNLYKKVKYKKY